MPTAPPLLFSGFPPGHRERLHRRAASNDWREILAREEAIEALRAAVRPAPEAVGQLRRVSEVLLSKDTERVRELVREGVRDEERLLAALSDGRHALEGDDRFPILFLGLVVTLDCSFLPRCTYCNQIGLPRKLTLDDLKALYDEAADPVPPYVYLTGGEPLLLAAEVWGDCGLVAHAASRGSAVNINTNAALLTPAVALQLVKVGTAKLHVSLDTPDDAVEDALLGRPGRTTAVLDGILNVQIARELLGVEHPKIHVNAVLTARNLDSFPDLMTFALGMRREGAPADDFALHLIPVGGSENSVLRPTASEWRRFYTETWERAESVWAGHQARTGVPQEERESIPDAFPFTSPWHRVRHDIDLDEYCCRAAGGEYWQGALSRKCYVAPTQAFVLPDGSQHWCGGHAIRRPPPLGNVMAAGLRENIRKNVHRLADLPNEGCRGCAGATCAINQSVERTLRRRVKQELDPEAGTAPD